MIKSLLIVLVALMATYNLNAQRGSENIEVIKGFGGYKYQVHGINLTRSQLGELLQKDVEASKLMKRANTNNTLCNNYWRSWRIF